MATDNPSIYAVKIIDHRTHLFFPFSFLDTSPRKWKRLCNNVSGLSFNTLVKRINETLGVDLRSSSESGKQVWKSMSKGGLAISDLLEHARLILGQGEDAHIHCNAYRLDKGVLKSLSNIEQLRRITFSNAASKRCGVDAFFAEILDVRLFLFRTGIGMMILSVGYSVEQQGEITAGILCEGNYRLAHDPKRVRGRSGVGRTNSEQDITISLNMLVEALLSGASRSIQVHSGRKSIYTQALLKYDEVAAPADKSNVALLARLLSLRQTSDYVPEKDLSHSSFYMPFQYIAHCLEREGAATLLIDKDQHSGFNRRFISDVGHNLYVPLYVIALHAHFWMIKQTEWIPTVASHNRKSAVGLEDRHEQQVYFRNHYYFPDVSQLTVHNEFYGRCLEVFRTDYRLKYIDDTTRELIQMVSARRTKWLERFSGGIAGFLITREILEAISVSGLKGSIMDIRIWLSMLGSKASTSASMEQLVHQVEFWERFIFFASLAGGIVGMLAAWFYGKRIEKE